MEDKLKNIEEMQKIAEGQPETVDEKPEGMEEKPEGKGEREEEIDEKTGDVNEERDGIEETADVSEETKTAEESAEDVSEKQTEAKAADGSGIPKESKAEAVEAKKGIAEKEQERIGKTALDKTNHKRKDKKNRKAKSIDMDDKTSRKKTAGYVEVAAAFLLILLSIWLFWNTRGTRLLYVSVMVGRVSRYYWIFLFAAVVIGVIGLVSLRSSRNGTRQN